MILGKQWPAASTHALVQTVGPGSQPHESLEARPVMTPFSSLARQLCVNRQIPSEPGLEALAKANSGLLSSKQKGEY